MRLAINPAACDGLGMCAHKAPDVIQLDPWGYPIVSDDELEGAEADQASRAIRACPRNALFVAS